MLRSRALRLSPSLSLLAALAAAACGAPPASAPTSGGPGAPSVATSSPSVATAPAAGATAPTTSARRSDGKPDLEAVHRIKTEAFAHGQVMDHLFWLTNVNGPRLTASPGFKTAAEWAARSLTAWGATNAHLEPWGMFGRAWSVQRFEIALVEPGGFARLSGVPLAWSRGTSGPVTASLVLAPLFPDREDRSDRLDLDRLARRIRDYAAANKGKLRGRFVLLDPLRDLELPADVAPARLDDKRLGELAQAPQRHVPEPWTYPLTKIPRDPKKRAALFQELPAEVLWDFVERQDKVLAELWRFFVDEGVAGVLRTDGRGEGSLFFAEDTGQQSSARTLPPPAVVLPPEDYDRLVRLVERNIPAKVRLDVAVTASEKDEPGVNVIAELPGGAKPDEIVMVGAHLDSWHAGTGATDNAAGCAVMLEAIRILRTLKLPLERTVRIGLWSGEEQGLYGSRGYVKNHFGDPVTMALRPEHAKLSVYLNVDNGSGKIRGVYLENNDMARPIFESWLAPFRDEGVSTLTLRKTQGTDHQSFDAVGLPGFQFVQDPLDYDSRTHHSNLDVYEHAQPGDLMQAAAVVATVVFEAANRPEAFPRKELPAPLVRAK